MSNDLSRELRLGFLIHDASRMRRNVVDRVLKPMGVTRSQWWVLAFLSRKDGMSQVTLADELEVGKVAIGGLIDRLERSGLVERRSDPVDRRVNRVYLTKLGHQLVKDIRNSVAKVEKEIVGGIGEADLQVTVRALRIMKANLQTLLGAGKPNLSDRDGHSNETRDDLSADGISKEAAAPRRQRGAATDGHTRAHKDRLPPD